MPRHQSDGIALCQSATYREGYDLCRIIRLVEEAEAAKAPVQKVATSSQLTLPRL